MRNQDTPQLLTYMKEWENWNASSEELGILRVDGELQIQLWRAQGTLDQFTCPGGRKRDEINELIKRLKEYKNERDPRYPFNCLFLAEPGWGKSYLAQCLAEHFGFTFLSFSIAEMESNEDLKNSLREVVSTQNRIPKPVLVFIDEIDAQIESHTAMGLFLGPMWSGSFTSEGNVFHIKPCVWVFASTKPRRRLIRDPKGRDFCSRINGPIIELDFFSNGRRDDLYGESDEEKRIDKMMDIFFSAKDSEPLRTELVYHGVNYLNQKFGPLSHVDRSVLTVFHDTMPVDGIRSVEILASRFHDVSRGRVSIKNAPDPSAFPELARHIRTASPWPGVDSGEVRVMAKPK